MRHEQWAHRQRIWRCPDHPQHEFSNRAEYEDHVNTQHAGSKHLLLSSELLTAQESVSCALDRPCPFCLRDYEDVFEMQQHVASHLEAMALLSVPILDEDKESAKENSNAANSNHAESKAGDFDSTEVLLFPENEGPGHLRSASEAERRAFRTNLGIIDQSFNEASSDSVIAKSGYREDFVREWLDIVPAGTRNTPKVDLAQNVVDTYKQLAQALREMTLEEHRNEHLLHLSRAVLTCLLDLLNVGLSRQGLIMHLLSNIEQPLMQRSEQWIDQLPSGKHSNITRIVVNMLRLLESIEGPLIDQGVSNFISAP